MLGSDCVFSLRIALAVMALVTAVTAISVSTVLAQNPSSAVSPAPTVFIDPLDPRAGAGANRVGAPLVALLAVVGIGVAAAVVTAVYVRVVRSR